MTASCIIRHATLLCTISAVATGFTAFSGPVSLTSSSTTSRHQLRHLHTRSALHESTIRNETHDLPTEEGSTEPSSSLSDINNSNDPSTSPNYHRKRRMAMAATGMVGKAAQIYSRYFNRLWKETNEDARYQSNHNKLVMSIKQLDQLLSKEKDSDRVMTQKVHDACKEYLTEEAATKMPIKSVVPQQQLQGSETASKKKNKQKNRRSIGFGALMGLGVAGMVFSGNYVFTGIFTLMTILGQLEYYRMVMSTGVLPARRISIVGACSMYITALLAPSLHEICLPLFGLYTMIFFLTMKRTVSTIPEIATTFSGMFYLGYVPSFWVRIRLIGSMAPPSLAPWAQPYATILTKKIQSFIPAFVLPAIHLPITSGAIFVFWTWLCIAFSDVGAYFVGKTFGKTKLGQLAPAAGEASPNKTVEGVLGGCAVSGMLGILGAWAQRWPYFILTGAVHGVMLALCGLIGDLTASMLKRDAGLKDFGDLLPEHGGIMDRVDSYIWTAPYSWLVISYALPLIRRFATV